MSTSVTVNFYRKNSKGELKLVHSEHCHDIFEAEQFIEDESHCLQYDSVEIIE